MEPAESVASAKAPIPSAAAADAPPLEPPAVRSRFHGLRAGGASRVAVMVDSANSEVLVLPSRVHPARRRRCTTRASGWWLSANGTEPYVVGSPFCSMVSLTETGTPQVGSHCQSSPSGFSQIGRAHV